MRSIACRSFYWISFLILAFTAACTGAPVSSLPSNPGEVRLPATAPACPTFSGEKSELCPPGASLATGVQPTAALALSLQPAPSTPVAPPLSSQRSITGTATLPATSFPSPCPGDLCYYSGTMLLSRPVAPPGRDVIDFSYRFGSTQGGKRDPHHGVELLNPFGKPVLAAGDGVVVVAGDDRKTFYGPYSYFYGNLVILQHAIPGLSLPFYTLYGHLSQIEVQMGQAVKAGQEIGKVGMSGVATGPHLHFEVRIGGTMYKDSRNPELWLKPHLGPSAQPNGALAGRILDSRGGYLAVQDIVVQHLPGPDQAADDELYADTYDDKRLVGQSPWDESFALGDIPAGWYRISFAQNGVQSQVVQVFPGQITMVTFRIGK
ncbi:MAG TPA: peptidoglycan DD-metalloendopeptidase family protein [Anaerolineales bacterium]